MIANTTYCVVPPEAQKKEKVGSLIQMNVEKIIRLHPDLILGSSFTKPKQIHILERFNIPVIKFENPKTFNDMCAMTLHIGHILGKEKESNRLVDQARAQVDAIVKQTSALEKRKVFFQIGIKPIHTPIRGTFVNEYIEFAGGINIANLEGEEARSEKYTREKVLQLNPDVILIAMMGSSRKAAENERENWLRFKSINASRNNKIYILDPDIICSPTPVTFIEGLNVIVTKLHPQP